MSDNPLLTPPREAVVEIWPGDVEQRLIDLEDAVNEAERLAEQASVQSSGEDRMGSKAKNKHAAEALRLAKEYDEVASSVTPVRLRLRAVPNRTYRQMCDAHPPRKGNQRDEFEGVDVDEFYKALAYESLVEPEVSAEQWDEFVAQVREADWRKIATVARELSTGEVDIPKSSLASALNQQRQRVARLRSAQA